jgi:pimeloyl-ACP methyl ester carboxylesterase
MTRSRWWTLVLILAGVTPAVSYAAAAQQPAAQQAAPQQPASAAPAAQPAPAQPTPAGSTRREARFRIFAAGMAIGGESIIVETSPTGWKVTSVGQAKAAAFMLNHAEIRYDAQSRPLAFKLEARVKESPLSINTTIDGGKATSEVIQDNKVQTVTHDVADTAVLLPNNVFGAYEAVAARLATLKPGATLRAYVAPQGEIAVTFDSVTAERVQTTARTFETKHYKLTAQNPGGAIAIDVWADDRDHLVRVTIAQAQIEVVRDDIAAVSTRQQTSFRPNDETVWVLANGFNLAATVSKPASATPAAAAGKDKDKGKPKEKPAKLPAIVLVAGSGLVDRDETVAGIPIFAQLANSLSDAGYLVVRYDKRGVGQSGGRMESATLADYAEDLRAVLRYLTDKRKDVDENRIAVAGHSEGAAIAMLAAQRDKKIRALVLMAGPGTTGAELILEQQAHALSRMNLPEAERQQRIGLQLKIQAAALSGQGWDGIPPELQRQANTPWFTSLLQYNPADAMKKVNQPILIVQGDLDRQVPTSHADKLAALAKERKKAGDVQVAKFATLNHLLVPAKTGEVDEYAKLETKAVAPEVAAKIAEWLNATLVKGDS